MSQTFLLTHGTWLGGWIWQRCTPLLEAMGHRVHVLTFTGCGDRAHLSRADVGLETHIQDILGVMDAEELSAVTLVGHSFGGVTITGAADRRREQIKRLVFFDAIVPRPGRMSGTPRDAATGELSDYFKKRMAKFQDGYKMQFWEDYPLRMLLNEGHPELDAIVQRHVTTHPMRGWTDVLSLQNGGWEGLPRSYIRAAAQKHAPSSDAMPGPAKGGAGWQWIDLAVDRLGMLTNPQLFAQTLANLDKA
jgi:pimeloyl-ACP methyl ester carboxylesterase